MELDIDDTSQYGPETITLNKLKVGRQKQVIHNFSEDGSMAASNAEVKVYIGDYVLSCKPSACTKNNVFYWHVFNIKVRKVDGGRMVTITDPSGFYENNPYENSCLGGCTS